MKKIIFKLTGTAQVLLLALFIISFFSSCTKEPKSDEKEMTDLVITPSSGANLTPLLAKNGKTWEFLIGPTYDQSVLKQATITFNLSKGATSIPKSGATVDFELNTSVRVVVKAEDGSTFQYSIAKEVGISSEAKILTFKLTVEEGEAREDYQGIVDDGKSKVTFDKPFPTGLKTALSQAIPTFTISRGASADPPSLYSRDFSTSPVTYEITAQDGTQRTWTVEPEFTLNNQTDITNFKLQWGSGEDATIVDCTIDGQASVIYYYMPSLALAEQLSEATPVFSVSEGASANIPSGAPHDFTSPVKIEITAEDGSTKQEWTVERRKRSDAEMTNFFLDFYENPQETYEWRGDVQNVCNIDNATGNITYIFPVVPAWFTKAHMTVIPAVIELSTCATVSPNWNEPLDFSTDQVYTVTSEDGTKSKTWTVKAPALPYFFKAKWSVDYATLRSGIIAGPGTDLNADAQNPNAIAIIDDYLYLSRSQNLIHKSDGTVSATNLNVKDIWKGNGQAAEPTAAWRGQDYPFFVSNDDEGNMIGCSLGAWNTGVNPGENPNNNGHFYVYKWTSAEADPQIVMDFPGNDNNVQFGSFGRKLQLIGDVNGNGVIISPNSILKASPANSSLEHYLWKIEDGVVDVENPVIVDSEIPWGSNQYQVITPSSPGQTGPSYWIGSHVASYGGNTYYPQLYLKTPTATWPVNGPFGAILGEASANGWGNLSWFYHKLFVLEGKDLIATFSSSQAYYCFCVMERGTDEVQATAAIPYDSNWTNGNVTGSFTFEKIGDDIFFYIFATNRIVACYQMVKF